MVGAECSYGRSAWLLAMVVLLVPVVGSSSRCRWRAFVPAPLPLFPCKLQFTCNDDKERCFARARPPRQDYYRYGVNARGATGASSTSVAAAEAAAEAQELRLLTWMEVSARIKSDIEEVLLL